MPENQLLVGKRIKESMDFEDIKNVNFEEQIKVPQIRQFRT